MFEFHGWAVIRSSCMTEDKDDEVERQELGRLLDGLRQQIADTRIATHFHLHPVHNDMVSLTVSGLRNHREAEVIEIFVWLATHGLGSYGLLYVLNDEDPRGDEYAMNFRVYQLARGHLKELADPFLSPPIPVVENEYEP